MFTKDINASKYILEKKMEFISLYQQENSYVIKAHPVCGFSKYKIRKHTVLFVSICEKTVKLKPLSRNINIPRKLLE